MKNYLEFKQYIYYVGDILTVTDIKLAINIFYLGVLINNTSKNNKKISIIFRLIDIKGNSFNISPLYIEDVSNIKDITDVLLFYWHSLSDTTKSLKIEKVVLLYKFINSDVEHVNTIFKCSKKLKLVDISPENFMDLPNNRVLETWGDDITLNANNTFIINKDDSYSYYVINFSNEYFVWLKNEYLEIQYFHDVYNPEDKSNNTFIRNIGKIRLYYSNGIYSIL